MTRKLRPYQEKALSYLQENGGGALFMEMRLGKTIVCIRYVHGLQGSQPTSGRSVSLVVAPVEGLWAWKRELALEGEEPTVLVGSRAQRLRLLWGHPNQQWFLINYEGFLSIQEEIKKKRWNFCILDESRRIANPKSKTTKALLRWNNWDMTRIALAGEPAPESSLEYFTQYAFLNGEFCGCKNYWQFRNNFFHELAPHEWVPIPGRLDRLKKAIQENAFFLTRKQAGLRNNKIYETRALKFPPSIQKMYEEIKRDFLLTLDHKVVATTKWVPVQYIWLQQLSSGFLGDKFLWDGKIKALFELLNGELKNEQVVVWYKFNAPLFETSRWLHFQGIDHRKIVGEESRDSREASIDLFRAGGVRILLCQVKCGKSAIDLSNSSTAVYFSNSHSLEERIQSEDRILNPAKHEPLLYLDLITEGSVEEDIVELLRDKKCEAQYFRSRLLNKLRQEILL
jgi:SNF2 family DNA or RNA helicase